MHDVLRARLIRKIESLPEEQVYQALDFVEFLETKYTKDLPVEASGLQGFAEKLEDQLRRRAVSPSSLREAFQLIAAADKVLSNVTKVGKDLLGDLNGGVEGKQGPGSSPRPSSSRGYRPPKGSSASSGGEGTGQGSSSRTSGEAGES
ncbi:MAG: DUF2281 domain-containing protein [Gemmatimonadota bacterium]